MSNKNEKPVRYSANTLISNWIEDLKLQELRLEDFRKKQRKSDLKVHHTRKCLYNLYQTLPLIQEGRYVRFGQVVQIVTPNTLSFNGEPGLTLCGTPTERDIDKWQHLSDESQINVSPAGAPSIKNIFRLMPCAGSTRTVGSDVRYGDEFLITTTTSGNGKPLYVKAEPSRAFCPGNALNHSPVTLTYKEDKFCTWRTTCLQSGKEEVMNKHSLEPGTTLSIIHIMSNKPLSAEPTTWNQTFFGPEADVTVHDYKSPKRTKCHNTIWMFQAGPKSIVPIKQPV